MKTKQKNDHGNGQLEATSGTRLAPVVTDLKQALSMVDAAVASRTSVQAMQHVLIERGRVVATDGEMRIETILPGAGVDAPPVLLSGDRLSRITATCDVGSELRLEPGKSSCTIKNKTGKWVLPTCSPDEFPSDATGKVWPLARLPGDQLARCLRTVLPAISRGKGATTIPSGLLIDVTDGVVTFVATDGYRLHAHAVEIDQATDNQAVMVPLRAATSILAIAEEAGFDAVQLGLGKTMLVAASAKTVLSAAPLNMKAPPWRNHLDKKTDEPTRVQAGSLLSATRAASITTSETSRGVTYSITDEGIMLTGKSAEAGESKVACDIFEPGKPCQVMMPPQHVAQFLESLESLEIVDIEATAPDSPVAIRCEDRLCIIAPMTP